MHGNFWRYKALHPFSLFWLHSDCVEQLWWIWGSGSLLLCPRGGQALGCASGRLVLGLLPNLWGLEEKAGMVQWMSHTLCFLHGGRDGWKKRGRDSETVGRDSQHFLIQFFKCCQTVGGGLVIVIDCDCSDFWLVSIGIAASVSFV